MSAIFPWFEGAVPTRRGVDGYPMFEGDPHLEGHARLDEWLAVADEAARPEESEVGAGLLALGAVERSEVVMAGLVRLSWNDGRGGDQARWPGALRVLMGRLLRHRLEGAVGALDFALRWMVDKPALKDMAWPVRSVLRQVEWHVEAQGGLGGALEASLRRLRASGLASERSAETREVAERVDRLLGEGEAPGEPLEGGEWWSEVALEAISGMGEVERRGWLSLLEHAAGLGGGRPSERWRRRARALIEGVGVEAFQVAFEGWSVRVGRTAAGAGHRLTPSDRNAQALKGLAWCGALASSEAMARAVCELAEVSFRKVPEVGPRSVKVGNACLGALGEMGWEGLVQLARLRQRIKYPSAQARIEELMAEEAGRRGASVEELEELAVPDCGLDASGQRFMAIGGGAARLAITGSLQAELVWLRADGRPLKSAPAQLKRDHPEELARAKALLRELQALLASQRDRIEGLWLTDRCWSYPQWKARFVDHPVLAALSKGLVWHLQRGPRAQTVMWREAEGGGFVDAHGNAQTWADEGTTVHLWHPADTAPVVQQWWRERLMEFGVTQPFKQAHREIWAASVGEQSVVGSARFEGNFLKQHQLAALCKQRGWRYQLQGPGFGVSSGPTLSLPAWGLEAEFQIKPVEGRRAVSESGVSLFVTAGRVQFRRQGQGGGLCALGSVPPRVFSEVMRGVDLFVTICGDEQGEGSEAEELSAAARTRREVLREMLPRLPFVFRCRLEPRALVVRGDLHTHRIHLGSGQVTRQESGEEVEVEASPDLELPVPLPFEGDRTLSLILSRAQALAGQGRAATQASAPARLDAVQTSLGFF